MRPLVARVGRLQLLAVFEAAARTGSFTAAAAELGMTQPAVTRQVRALERRVGVELFTRTANRSTLSEAGTRLWGQVAAGFEVIEGGLAELVDRPVTVVLATHPGLAQQWLLPRLDGLSAALPGIELRLWLFDRDSELDGGGYDAAIRVGDGRFPGGSRLLFGEAVTPVATPALARAWGLHEGSSAAEVLAAPLIHMDDGQHPWMTWGEWAERFGHRPARAPGRVLLHSYPMVLQQALAGRGVALGWRHLVDAMLEDGVLVPVGPAATSGRGYYLTWPGQVPPPAVQPLLDWVRDELDGPDGPDGSGAVAG